MGDVFSGECYTGCKSEITIFNFECGHIISVKEGGSNMIDNLKPICGACNKSMGAGNMAEFAAEMGYKSKLLVVEECMGIHILTIPGDFEVVCDERVIGYSYRIHPVDKYFAEQSMLKNGQIKEGLRFERGPADKSLKYIEVDSRLLEYLFDRNETNISIRNRIANEFNVKILPEHIARYEMYRIAEQVIIWRGCEAYAAEKYECDVGYLIKNSDNRYNGAIPADWVKL